jgi:hypothetical protein
VEASAGAGLFKDVEMRILVGALWLGALAGLLFWLLRTTRTPRPAPSDVPAEFRRRMRRVTRYGVTPLVCGFVAVLAGAWLAIGTDQPVGIGIAIGAAGLVAFAGGQLYVNGTYRCPACEGLLLDEDTGVINGVRFDLQRCPRCEVPLA